MNKLFILQSALLKEIDKYEKLIPERDYSGDWERVHISSCAKIGMLMAQARGVDPILAACACACHDYGRIVTGRQENHAEAGYEPIKEFLKGLRLFSDEDIMQIAQSVRNHSSKSEIGTPLEEIVKDADVLDFHQYGYEMPRKEQQERLERILGENFVI